MAGGLSKILFELLQIKGTPLTHSGKMKKKAKAAVVASSNTHYTINTLSLHTL